MIRDNRPAIIHVSWRSVAIYFAAFYGLVGFIVGSVGSVSSNLLTVPIGFLVPFLHLVVNLNAPRGTSFFFVLLVLSPILNGLTGFISGAACAVIYNLLASYGFAIRGTAKTSESSS